MARNNVDNPYIFGMMSVLMKYCVDYADASRALRKNPEDIWGTIIHERCIDFADWMCEVTGLDYVELGELIIRMLEEDCNDQK